MRANYKNNGMFKMKIQNNSLKKSQPFCLFARLNKKKRSQEKVGQIYGVEVIQSDCSDDESYHHSQLEVVKQKLSKYKHEKALEVLDMHRRTGVSIEQISKQRKDQYSYQALCMIDQKYEQSGKKLVKELKEGGSTQPSSVQRLQLKQTPGFDLQGTENKPIGIDIDLRQFTLGQREQLFSLQKMGNQNDEHFVTEFQTNTLKSTKNIKNKIMMKKINVEFS